MKQQLKLILFVLVLLITVGCWDRHEINDVAIVTGTGFDMLADDTYKVSVQVPLPSSLGGAGSSGGGGGTSGGSTVYVDAGIGRNVREANSNLQNRMSRQLHFGHRRISIFGEKLARSGIQQTLDVLTRTREARLSTQIFVVEGEAIDVLSVNPQLESFSSETVREIGVNTFNLTLKDFLSAYQKEGNDPIVPVLTVVKNISPNPELVQGQIEMNKVAIFKRDKLEFITNEKQTSAVKWMREEKAGETMTIEMEPEKNIEIEIKEQNTEITYRIENEKPVFDLTINLEGNVIENETSLNFEETGTLTRITDKITKQVEGEINSLLNETFKRGIDSFGFGWLLYRRERDRWSDDWEMNWRELLPDLNYEIKVDSNVEFTGLVTQGIGIGE